MSSEVFTSLANSNFNIQKSSFLAPNSKLDPERTVTRSDSKGIAKLYLRVRESPLDSKVRIVCQSGGTMSSPSTKIKIEHPIRKITQEVKNMTEKVKSAFNKDSNGFKKTKVTLKSTIKLNLWELENTEEDIIRADDVSAELLSYSDVLKIRSSDINITEVTSAAVNASALHSPLENLYDLGKTLMRGIQTVNIIKTNQKKDTSVFFPKEKIQNHTVSVSNITIVVPKPGKYALVFNINGVYTDIREEEFSIEVQEDISVLKRTFDWGETAFLTGFYFLTLVFASKMVKGYWLFIAILLTAGYVYLVTFKSNVSKIYMFAVYFFAAIIGVFLIWNFLLYFIDAWIKKKVPSYFFNKKREYYIEYTYQRLNGHPSNYWVNKTKKLGMKLDGYYNTKPRDHSDMKMESVMSTFAEAQENKRPIDHDMTNSLEMFRAQSEHSLLYDYMPEPKAPPRRIPNEDLRHLPVDVLPYKDLGR